MGKLSAKNIERIKLRREKGDRYQDIADDFGVCRTTIWNALRGTSIRVPMRTITIRVSAEQDQQVRMEALRQNIQLSAYFRQLIDNANTKTNNKGGN